MRKLEAESRMESRIELKYNKYNRIQISPAYLYPIETGETEDDDTNIEKSRN